MNYYVNSKMMFARNSNELSQITNALASAGRRHYVVILDDITSDGMPQNYLSGGILLPDTGLICLLTDYGDRNAFNYKYYEYLDDTNAMYDPGFRVQINEFIVMLLLNMILRGIDIVFYLQGADRIYNSCDPKVFHEVLFTYILKKYGTVIRGLYDPYGSINPNYFDYIISKNPEFSATIMNLCAQENLAPPTQGYEIKPLFERMNGNANI